MRRSIPLVVAALIFGCDDTDSPAPGPGSGSDAGALEAGASMDSGAADTGTSSTAGNRDAGAGPIDECDPVRQSGCNDPANPRCIVENPIPTDGTRCVGPSAQDIAFQQACQGGDCAPGLVCVNGGAGPVCEQICDRGDGTGCATLGSDWDCRRHLRGTNWGVCTELPPACDAQTNAPCDANQACHPMRLRNGTFELRCLPAGNGGHNDPCNDGNARCGRGTVCVRVGASGNTECRKICTDNMQCPNMGECSGQISAVQLRYCHP